MAFDLNAVAGEAEGKPFTFTWGDGDEETTFSIPTNADVRWLSSLQSGNIHTALVRLLGPDQYNVFNAITKPFRKAQFAALIAEYNKHIGVDEGKSTGSSKRSTSTGPKSRRISSSSTT